MNKMTEPLEDVNTSLENLAKRKDFPRLTEDGWKSDDMKGQSMKIYVKTKSEIRIPAKWLWKHWLNVDQTRLKTNQITSFFEKLGFETGSLENNQKAKEE